MKKGRNERNPRVWKLALAEFCTSLLAYLSCCWDERHQLHFSMKQGRTTDNRVYPKHQTLPSAQAFDNYTVSLVLDVFKACISFRNWESLRVVLISTFRQASASVFARVLLVGYDLAWTETTKPFLLFLRLLLVLLVLHHVSRNVGQRRRSYRRPILRRRTATLLAPASLRRCDSIARNVANPAGRLCPAGVRPPARIVREGRNVVGEPVWKFGHGHLRRCGGNSHRRKSRRRGRRYPRNTPRRWRQDRRWRWRWRTCSPAAHSRWRRRRRRRGWRGCHVAVRHSRHSRQGSRSCGRSRGRSCGCYSAAGFARIWRGWWRWGYASAALERGRWGWRWRGWRWRGWHRDGWTGGWVETRVGGDAARWWSLVNPLTARAAGGFKRQVRSLKSAASDEGVRRRILRKLTDRRDWILIKCRPSVGCSGRVRTTCKRGTYGSKIGRTSNLLLKFYGLRKFRAWQVYVYYSMCRKYVDENIEKSNVDARPERWQFTTEQSIQRQLRKSFKRGMYSLLILALYVNLIVPISYRQASQLHSIRIVDGELCCQGSFSL